MYLGTYVHIYCATVCHHRSTVHGSVHAHTVEHECIYNININYNYIIYYTVLYAYKCSNIIYSVLIYYQKLEKDSISYWVAFLVTDE